MKAYIHVNERWPDYIVTDEYDRWADYEADVDAETFARWKATIKAYEAMIDEIGSVAKICEHNKGAK